MTGTQTDSLWEAHGIVMAKTTSRAIAIDLYHLIDVLGPGRRVHSMVRVPSPIILAQYDLSADWIGTCFQSAVKIWSLNIPRASGYDM